MGQLQPCNATAERLDLLPFYLSYLMLSVFLLHADYQWWRIKMIMMNASSQRCALVSSAPTVECVIVESVCVRHLVRPWTSRYVLTTAWRTRISAWCAVQRVTSALSCELCIRESVMIPHIPHMVSRLRKETAFLHCVVASAIWNSSSAARCPHQSFWQSLNHTFISRRFYQYAASSFHHKMCMAW